MRDSFVFYKSFAKGIKCLSDADRLKIYDAIVSYALDGDALELDGVAECIFELIKPQIDANQKKYEDGKKGGRPKKEENGKNHSFENKKTSGFENKKPNVNENENVNENVNVNENDNVCFLKNRNKNLDECVDYFKKHFGEVTKEVRQGMEVFVYGGMDTDCILFAMQEAVDRGALSWQYVEGILNNWYDKGYRAAYDVVGETKIYKQNIVESYQDVKRRKEENTA